MNNKLIKFIEQNKELLETGEVLTALLNDGVATIYNEVDLETQKQKTVTLFGSFDVKFDCGIAEVI